jgi:hypothetical protein
MITQEEIDNLPAGTFLVHYRIKPIEFEVFIIEDKSKYLFYLVFYNGRVIDTRYQKSYYKDDWSGTYFDCALTDLAEIFSLLL